MKPCKLTIQDQVNIKLHDLDAQTRREIVNELKFVVPYARHTIPYKLGRWDGKVGFATVGGGSYFNLLDRILPILVQNGYDPSLIDIEDKRVHPDFVFPKIDDQYLAHISWPEGHPAEGEPIVLRDYQVEAINTYFENLQSIQCLSTGSGKTITTASLSMACEKYGRTIVIVPSKSLVEQTEEDYRNVGLDVGVFFGERKEWGHQHTICTWQSLGSFCKKKDDFSNLEETFDKFIEDVVCVMVDECHTAKANVLKDLLTGPMAHIPIRWGMTGTVPKQDFEAIPLLVSIGPVVGEVKAKRLQDEGVLADCDISIIQTDDSAYSKTFKDYTEEYNYLVNDNRRVKWIADFIDGLEGNTLILVDRISTAKLLHTFLPHAVVISGSTKMAKRKEEFKDVNNSDSKVIIATYGVAAVGINVPKINNLVALEFGKSFVRCIQSIGRILRKAKDKVSANVYDICSTLKYSNKHKNERIKYYTEAEYNYTKQKVSY